MLVFSRHVFHQRSPLQISTSEVDQQSHPIENLEPFHFEPTFSDHLTQDAGFSSDKDQRKVVIDEADDYSVPRSPLLSECRTDGSDNIPQATYIVLSSHDLMQLTVTRSAVDVLADISMVS